MSIRGVNPFPPSNFENVSRIVDGGNMTEHNICGTASLSGKWADDDETYMRCPACGAMDLNIFLSNPHDPFTIIVSCAHCFNKLVKIKITK